MKELEDLVNNYSSRNMMKPEVSEKNVLMDIEVANKLEAEAEKQEEEEGWEYSRAKRDFCLWYLFSEIILCVISNTLYISVFLRLKDYVLPEKTFDVCGTPTIESCRDVFERILLLAAVNLVWMCVLVFSYTDLNRNGYFNLDLQVMLSGCFAAILGYMSFMSWEWDPYSKNMSLPLCMTMSIFASLKFIVILYLWMKKYCLVQPTVDPIPIEMENNDKVSPKEIAKN